MDNPIREITEKVSVLTKLVITAYENPEFTKLRGVYQTAMNPEKYSEAYKTTYNQVIPPGGAGGPLEFVRIDSEDLSLDFLFDRTGVVTHSLAAGPDLGVGIHGDIFLFKKVVYNYDGEAHKPNYLRINWGTLNFTCVLSDLSIEYKLFDPNGKPLRAVAKAKFIRFEDGKINLASLNKHSPDLTHVRTVNEGDTLPLMTANIYGDPKYYLEVAKVNKLTTFRKLKAGQQIIFPPLQKPS